MSEQSEAIRPCQHVGPSRRAVVSGVVGAGGVCLLAACGSSSGSGSTGGSDTASDEGAASADAAAPSGVPVSDVSLGGGVIVGDVDPPYVVTQPSEGDYRAFSAVCTHTGCTVGSVEDNEIVCPCHGSRFDASSGEVLQGPASGPLPERQVTDEGGTLVVS